MAILVVAENSKGQFKKASKEAISYGSDLATKMGTEASVLVLGPAESGRMEELGQHGIAKVIHLGNEDLELFDASQHAAAIADVAGNIGADVIVVSNTYYGKAITGRLAVRMDASLASDVISMAELSGSDLRIRRAVFSNKGFADLDLTNGNKIIALSPNSYKVKEGGMSAAVESIGAQLAEKSSRVIEQKLVEGKIPLTEAELVVSGGRGLKGPENWHLIENLANSLGAATACSKPVSDMDWRPHEEHVGQTGITIKPDLYVACGISGAIQHLAGVSSSKVIVVVNTDPEAPFFKVADYGVVGDAFEVLPKLKEAVEAFKANA